MRDLVWALAVIFIYSISLVVAEKPPDASECQFCKKCVGVHPRRRLRDTSIGYPLTPRLEKALFGGAHQEADNRKDGRGGSNRSSGTTNAAEDVATSAHHEVHSSANVPANISQYLDEGWMYMSNKDIRTNYSLCETCTGCTAEIELLATSEVQKTENSSSIFKPPLGRSSGWLFRAPSKKAFDGDGIAKVWCIPFKKAKGIKVDECDTEQYEAVMAKVTGLNKLARDCGVSDIIPGSWVEHVKALMPGTGYVIDRPGLFADRAPGVSARFLASSHQENDKKEALRIFQSVRSEDVVRASVFDLFIGNCDRHPGNLFLDEDGIMTLIDNDMALSPKCVANSIFLPSTKYHAQSSKHSSLLDMLDYRCHANGRRIKTHFPEAMTKCLRKVQSMTVENVADLYGFPSLTMSSNLKHRAHQLLTMGFEWTLFESAPLGRAEACMQRYMDHKPCCNFELLDNRLHCKDRHYSDELQHLASNEEPCPVLRHDIGSSTQL